MFRKLHIQMTVFSALVTSSILVTMAMICLITADSAARKNHYSSFEKNAMSCIIHLEGETILSHQWLRQAQNTYGVYLKIQDNGNPLFFDKLNPTEEHEEVFRKAEEISRETYALDLDAVKKNTAVTESILFPMKDYYVCAARIPKNGGMLSFILLYPLDALNHQLNSQRLSFAAAILAAVAALSVFSWFFVKKMIRPLEENRRLQTEFIASASHELRSPLTVIQSGISALELILRENQQTDISCLPCPEAESSFPQTKKFFSMISRECSRMTRLIDDLLTLANADNHSWKLSVEPCELDTLLLETYDAFLLPAEKKHLRMEIELPEEEIPPCRCDPSRITQVLSILLDNAISCVPEGGRITLSLKFLRDSFRLSVSDNGPGIPEDKKEAIFRRFYKMDASRTDKQHFGLGLPIAKEIINLHHGSLTVSDAPQGGACFLITLP